jgi:hypothetical protein
VKTIELKSAMVLVMMAFAGSALVGCTPDFDHVELELVTTPPLPVSVGQRNVDLPVGVAVGVIATPFDTNGEKMDDDDVVFDLISDNEGVIGVETSVDESSFVLFGVGPGTTTISVEVDHLKRSDIPVTVKLQPAP